jgi:hypothetical protein
MADTDTAEVLDAGTAEPETSTDAPQDLISFLRSSADIDESEVEVAIEGEVEGEPDAEPDPDESDEDAETDKSAAKTETEQPKPFDELSDDELSEHPKVKSLIARRGESMRQQTERETANRLFDQQQRFVASGEATEAFLDLVRTADLDDNGTPKVDPKRASELTSAFINRGSAQTLNTVAGVLNAATGESFTLTEAEKEAVDNAYARYQQTSDPTPLVRSWLKAYDRHAIDSQRDTIKADALKQARKEVDAGKKVQQAQSSTEERKGRQPTGVNGTPVSTKNTWDSASDDLSRNGVEALKRLNVSY